VSVHCLELGHGRFCCDGSTHPANIGCMNCPAAAGCSKPRLTSPFGCWRPKLEPCHPSIKSLKPRVCGGHN